MNIAIVLGLIACACSIEILLCSKSTVAGLFFALASFGLVKLDGRLVFLALAITALHVFYTSLQELRNLLYTQEAQSRQGYIRLLREAYQLSVAQSLRNL